MNDAIIDHEDKTQNLRNVTHLSHIYDSLL